MIHTLQAVFGTDSLLIGTIVPFLFVLLVVVFVHEMGHYLVGRWCGIGVSAFSIGFGPELFGFNDRHGTRWKLSAIPLGGYVKFFGDDSEASTPSSATLSNMTEEERAVSFHHKKVGPRAAVVAAGPIANFILAIVIFTCLFTFFGKPSTTARVDQVEAGSAAEKAGFQVGDVVLAIDGKTIGSFSGWPGVAPRRSCQKPGRAWYLPVCGHEDRGIDWPDRHRRRAPALHGAAGRRDRRRRPRVVRCQRSSPDGLPGR